MPHEIPLSRPDFSEADIAAVAEALTNPGAAGGSRVEAFEQACARHAGREFGIAVSSGTAGLHCALLAAGIKAGDKVLTTPFSAIASTNSILYAGAIPVYVDIDPKTLNLDPAKIQCALTSDTQAILAVDVFGHPGGMAEVEQLARKHEIPLIEDACDGFGARWKTRAVGGFGRASVFSFSGSRPITTGEGGMIVTDDERLADLCRSLRDQGRDGTPWLAHQRLGFSYRMPEMNAALGLAQLQRLDNILERRRAVAREYFERLMTSRYVILPTIEQDTVVSWCAFVVRLNDLFEPGDRDQIIRMLRTEDVGCTNHFPPIHLQPHVANLANTRTGSFLVCEYVSQRTISLPFFTTMTSAQVAQVCKTLEQVVEKMLMTRDDRMLPK